MFHLSHNSEGPLNVENIITVFGFSQVTKSPYPTGNHGLHFTVLIAKQWKWYILCYAPVEHFVWVKPKDRSGNGFWTISMLSAIVSRHIGLYHGSHSSVVKFFALEHVTGSPRRGDVDKHLLQLETK